MIMVNYLYYWSTILCYGHRRKEVDTGTRRAVLLDNVRSRLQVDLASQCEATCLPSFLHLSPKVRRGAAHQRRTAVAVDKVWGRVFAVVDEIRNVTDEPNRKTEVGHCTIVWSIMLSMYLSLKNTQKFRAAFHL